MKKIYKATAVLLIAAAVLFVFDYTENSETVEKGKVVTEADSGKTLTLEKGENFTLRMKENPSTGYNWNLDVSGGLTVLSDEYSQDPAFEDYAGSPGTHTWIIEAEDTGRQKVKGTYKRSWEWSSDGEKSFKLTVRVV